MRILLLIAIPLCCLAANSQAQVSKSQPNIRVGQTIKFQWTSTKKQWRNKVIRQDIVSHAEQKLTISEKLEAGYQAKYVTEKFSVASPMPGQQQMMDAIVRPLVGKAVTLEINNLGHPIKIPNWKVLIQPIFDVALKQLESQAKLPASKLKPTKEALSKIFNSMTEMSDTAAAQRMAQNVALWSAWHGFELELGQKFEFKTSSANPLGGAALQLDGVAELTSVDNGIARISVQQVVPGDQLVQMTVGLLKRFGLSEEKLKPAILSLKKQGMRLRFDQKFEIDMKTGLTRKLMQKKTGKIGSIQESIDEITLTATVSTAK